MRRVTAARKTRRRESVLSASGIVSLTTDFGLSDHFVGVMKGVILGINPEATLVDLSHEVAPFGLLDAAYTLDQGCRFFPPGTVHLVVVDPGVGSARRPIVAGTETASFVAPDNGVLSMIYAHQPPLEVREIDVPRYALKPTSSTFHGRDIFAPVAAWLSKGVPAREFGRPISDYVRIPIPQPIRSGERTVEGAVLKVDHFGNLITNLTPDDVPELLSTGPRRFRILIEARPGQTPVRFTQIHRLVHSFSEGSAAEPFAILGSSGCLEIAVNQGSAAAVLKARRLSRVRVEFEPQR